MLKFCMVAVPVTTSPPCRFMPCDQSPFASMFLLVDGMTEDVLVVVLVDVGTGVDVAKNQSPRPIRRTTIPAATIVVFIRDASLSKFL